MLRVYTIPSGASIQRGFMDPIIKILISIAAIVFVWVVSALSYVLVYNRRREGDETPAAPVRGNSRLEITWTIIQLLVVIGVSFYGGITLDRMQTKPSSGVLNVDVQAFRWGWRFSYPDYNVKSLYLELEANRQVELHLSSLDVVHAFWVPELGPKQDIVPGMMMHLTLMPDRTGEYVVYCDQLCGAGHTNMTAPVYVVSHAEFQTWVQQHQTVPTTTPTATSASTAGALATQGQVIFTSSCAKCHGDSGQGGTGPRLVGNGQALSRYTSAQGLLSFMSSAMPLDAPGSLNHQQYLSLLAYLLTQNGYMQSSAKFDETLLGSVMLK